MLLEEETFVGYRLCREEIFINRVRPKGALLFKITSNKLNLSVDIECTQECKKIFGEVLTFNDEQLKQNR